MAARRSCPKAGESGGDGAGGQDDQNRLGGADLGQDLRAEGGRLVDEAKRTPCHLFFLQFEASVDARLCEEPWEATVKCSGPVSGHSVSSSRFKAAPRCW